MSHNFSVDVMNSLAGLNLSSLNIKMADSEATRNTAQTHDLASISKGLNFSQSVQGSIAAISLGFGDSATSRGSVLGA